MDDFGKVVNKTEFYYIHFHNYLFTKMLVPLKITSNFPEKNSLEHFVEATREVFAPVTLPV
jgi:hypothetical protein